MLSASRLRLRHITLRIWFDINSYRPMVGGLLRFLHETLYVDIYGLTREASNVS